MRELIGLEPEEVCKESGISASNYWVTMHRARLRLRECLEQRWFSPGGKESRP
jgi:RNA polymerase sigma-70 factor (ECF subfamily)